ncbi:MAG TPA: hypothetical protein VJH89_01375, partial [Patescibacteria group bacterium]|nr:hypothetical protein [Patescibacteria group bacterium]
MDCYATYYSELCYEVVSSLQMFRSFFADRSDSSNDCAFIFDCKGCTSCFGCTNLRSKSYYIFNEPYTKEEYAKKIKELDLGSYKILQEVKKKFEDFRNTSLHKSSHTINAQNSTGDNIRNVMNCKSCFDLSDSKDCKYSANGGFGMNDSYDGYGVGEHAELLYEAFDTGVQASKLLFVGIVWGGHDVLYSYNCQNSENCFGCVGLRKKSYCIFNKQYSKEEYETLLPKIIEHMKSAKEYGEFFPTSYSPFGYNETIAQDYFPLTKEQALARGYKWRDKEKSEHQTTIKASDLKDHIEDVDDAILKEIIECSNCHRPYRIIKKELDFLKRFNIALPRK